MANQLNAPLTIGPQADLGQAAGLAFSSTLIDFLSAERRHNMAMSVPDDLPGRTAAPTTIPVQVGSPLSVFALGTYAALDRTTQNRAAGSIGNTYGADFGGVTAGLMYQATPNLVLGAAFNYLSTSVDLRGTTNARIDLDSFQGAGFASLSFPNFFADAAFTYGGNDYRVDRPGVLNDRLSAAPGGDTFTASARVGYLFEFGTFKAGPVGEVAYANVHVNAYRESGDPLLTLGVRSQNLEGLTAGGGVQIRTALPAFGGLLSPFLNLTAQHDFLDGVRTVGSFQTYAPALLIRTQAGRVGDGVYGRVAGGFDVDLGNALSGVVAGSTSFARSGGDDHVVSAGLRYRF
ncbi:autotransporter outer membrane beta-barrel domain-containing protein [Methylobacterium planeticum]|uniref:Autotransporter outer membrane beta-barrel domain-containing protein n=1 Tax=Methylobacterium planeticum TaxID=2615211 RepID=A0A6N6MUM0_9HYPH|nr:autotransporter outer membrane beta-barrel domain-containing protein [Methylobacterium planeticum]KAB1072509.1 autotransporter outer membrane beta-barrel domain-containing protein [Methylobacterium planeticum]